MSFVRVLIVTILSTFVLNAGVFEKNCMLCHAKLPASLQDIFKRYLLVYGGEKNVKAGIAHYLKYPNRDISVMGDLFIKRYGIKSSSSLSDKEIKEAVDTYWQRYKIIGRLK